MAHSRTVDPPSELKDRWVEFRICDVYLPTPEEVLRARFGEHLLRGRVTDLSEGGGEWFAVVDVEDLEAPVVVSVTRLRGVA